MTEDLPSLAKNLRTALQVKDLTPEALAAGSGVHKTTVYRILNGTTTSPRAATLRRISRALDVAIDELTGDPRQLLLDPVWTRPARETAPDPTGVDPVLDEFRRLPEWLQRDGAAAVLLTLADLSLRRLEKVGGDEGRPNGRNGRLESVIRRQWEAVPPEMRLSATEDAVRSLVSLRLAGGKTPDMRLFGELTAMRKERERRQRRLRSTRAVGAGMQPEGSRKGNAPKDR